MDNHPTVEKIEPSPEVKARARIADMRLTAFGDVIRERHRIIAALGPLLPSITAGTFSRTACACAAAAENVSDQGEMHAHLFWPPRGCGELPMPSPRMDRHELRVRAAACLLLELERQPGALSTPKQEGGR